MTRYESGATFERKLKKHLVSKGYLVVRSAGSRGLVDLMALSPTGCVCLIQCKRSRYLNEPRLVKLAERYGHFENVQVMLVRKAARKRMEDAEVYSIMPMGTPVKVNMTVW